MAENTSRKFRRIIDYVEDEAGVDIPRDVKKAAIAEVDIQPGQELPINLTEIGGVTQAGANFIAVLESEGDDELRVVSPNPLDASAAEIDVDLNSQSLSEVVSRLTDSTGAQVDPLARQDTTPVTGSTSTAGTNVALVLGDYRTDTDFFVDVSGSAQLTVEVRTSGGTWRSFDTVSYSSATTEVEQYSTAFAEIRARVDQNLTALEGSAKGV